MLLKGLFLVRKNLLVILVILLAFFLRFSHVSLVPPALNWDEVSHGYNAYSILKTGKDEWGKRLPIIFRAYGDYKLPFYIYLTLISEFFFGLSALSVRLPSILAGTFSVLFTYLLVKKLFKSKELAIIAGLLLALEPWGLFVSRVAVEANLSLALIISGVYFLWLGLEKKSWPILLGIGLLSLSVWTYNSARIFVPLLLLGLSFIYKREVLSFYQKNKKIFAFCILIFAFFFLPMFYQLFNPVGQARYQWVEILDQGMINRINEERLKTELTPLASLLIHNKVTYFTKTFLANYFSHFSPEFLFLKGGSHYQFSLPEHGLLYAINCPFFLLGLIVVVKRMNKEKSARLLLSWFLLGPIASSLTREAPHVLRSIVLLPIPMIFSALGLNLVWQWLKARPAGGIVPQYLFAVIYIFLLGLSIENYGQAYAFEYRQNYSWSWQYGYKEVVDYSRTNYQKYEKFIITKKYGEPHEFFLFYWPWEPARFQNDPELIRFYQSNWYWLDRFDKFYFVNDWQIPTSKNGEFILESGEKADCQGKDCLLITGPGNYPQGWHKLKTINFLDGQPAFEIYEN